MAKFVVRRVFWTIPVILLVILFTFLMMRQIEGNPFRKTERAIPEAIQQNLERKYHLDKPWYVQYAYYVKGVFTFDLGPSLELGLYAMLFAVVVGVPLGAIAALRQNSLMDYAAMFVSNVGFSIPSFLV